MALAGYFAIVAPNGIRVGDRVSLQGPFSWVHGEVADIGFLRIKLRELTGDPPQPTGHRRVPELRGLHRLVLQAPGAGDRQPRTTCGSCK